MRRLLASLALIVCLVAAQAGITPAASAPRHVYLTWQGDTSTTITVNYHTAEEAAASEVRYDTESRGGDAARYRYRAAGTRHKIPGLPDGRTIHWVELTGLQPGTTYYFVAGDAQHGYSPERKFRTIPNDGSPIRFVTGGDMGVAGEVGAILAQAGKQDPMFCAVGGDIAYVNGVLTEYAKWDTWLDNWAKHMVTSDGHVIPMVLAIGNHEVNRKGGSPANRAPFYLGYFAQAPGRTYFTRRFGPRLALLTLDTSHIAGHGGYQARWLELELIRLQDVPVKFALYHVPLYPTHRVYEGGGSVAGRQHWLPLFDRYGLTAAFENHDHTFKRTKRLRGNKVDPNGVLYLGDGCFGRNARTVDATRRWYEEKAASIIHVWRVDVSANGVEYRAIDRQGRVFDVYPPTAAGAAEAERVYQELIAGPQRISER